MDLDDPAALARADARRTYEVLTAFPAQCRAARDLRPDPQPEGARPRLVVVAGMGGSASGADIVAACAAERLDLPILVHRGYGLPAAAGDRDLVVVVSYSGETVEALSAVEAAIGRGCRVAVLTAGGRLAALARRQLLPLVTLPSGLAPRMALGYLCLPLLAVLRAVDVHVVKEAEVEESLGVLEALAAELGPAGPGAVNEAKRLASAIGDRLPVVYGGPFTGAVAYRWKTDLEENAKTFAAAGAVPEMNHNEIETWSGPQARRRHLVLLRDYEERPEIAERFAVMQEIIGPGGGGVSEAWSRGRSGLARLLSLAYCGLWTSYYLALLRGVDPWAVPVLEALKARLGTGPR